jgi:hypothetical protein
MNQILPSADYRCCDGAHCERSFERSLTFAEIAELSEQYELPNLKQYAASRAGGPITFVLPAFQLVASISRFVE